MRIAYLLLVHTDAQQVNRLITTLDNGRNIFFIHVDKTSSIDKEIIDLECVHLITERYHIRWGHFSMVEAMIALCASALGSGLAFDYCILLSGQDYPIKNNHEIEKFLTKHHGKQFFKVSKLPYPQWEDWRGGFDRLEVYFPGLMIDRTRKTWYMRHYWVKVWRALGFRRNMSQFEHFYGVSQWFSATYEAIAYLISYIQDRPGVVRFFRNTFIPDEIMFNTIIMNSPYKDKVIPSDLRLIQWNSEQNDPSGENPKVWKTADYDELMRSNALFARKFDTGKDSKILDLLDDSFRSG